MTSDREGQDGDGSSIRAVLLTNFISPNMTEVFRGVARRLATFTVLLSVPMEANRQWSPDHEDLDVVVQRNVTFRRRRRHPSGYAEDQFVHVPYDSWRQLARRRPDVVVSHELGARSIFAAMYARRYKTAFVLCVFLSERTEAGLARRRSSLRRRLVRRADVVTCNGPSGRRYLVRELGVDVARLMPVEYAADPRKLYRGSIRPFVETGLEFLTIGQLVERKGVEPALAALVELAVCHPDEPVVWNVVGVGPLHGLFDAANLPANLRVDLLGHLEPDEIVAMYARSEVLLFPTLADEWGLVTEEALGSGLAVLGSVHSQSVETLVQDDINGFTFDPERPGDILVALERWRSLAPEQRVAMRERGRGSVVERTPERAADQLVVACEVAIARRGRRKQR